LLAQQAPQFVTEPTDARRPCGHVAPRDLTGDAKSNDRSDVLRPWTDTAFMPGAEDQRRERRAATDEQGPHALRPVDLVTSDRQQVDAQGVDVHRHLAD